VLGKLKIDRTKNPTAELSSGELAAFIKGWLQPVATLGAQLRTATTSVFRALWPEREVPKTFSRLAQWMGLAPTRIEIWKESAAWVGAEQALSFVLSWYKGVDLDQLEHRRKGGLDDVDLAKLHRRACTIAECADTDGSSTLVKAKATKMWAMRSSRCPASQGLPWGDLRTLPAIWIRCHPSLMTSG
jgi:hypothetical protein